MPPTLQPISKEELIRKFHQIYEQGWIKNTRAGNDGAVGNLLEDLLGIPENNLPIPNAAEWELKAQRARTTSLTTLFHSEPSPTALSMVPNVLLPVFGWPHREAGAKYPKTERSFRATLNASQFSDRGFTVNVNDKERKIEILFDASHVESRHDQWLLNVKRNLVEIPNANIVPYWGFSDLFHRVASKLHNCFYVRAQEKVESVNGRRQSFFWYNYVLMLSDLNEDCFIQAFRDGKIYVDFDARTGHNHGTKVRINHRDVPSLYKHSKVIIGGE